MKTLAIATQSLHRGTLAVFVAALALSACATPSVGANDPVKSTPLRSQEECLFTRTVDDWTPLSDEQLIIYGPGRRQAFLTTLNFPSHDLKYGLRLGFLDSDNNGRLCSFDSIIIPDGVPDRIQIRSMVRIDEAEAKRLIAATKKPPKVKKKKVD
ncbi:MAG: DUF6491 family protein [Pseudomonadota bacterium]